MRRLAIWPFIVAVLIGTVPIVPEHAQATLSPVTNFAKGTVSTGYDSAAVSITLTAGHGAKFPSSFPYPLVWFNSTDYSSPEDDPSVEIVLVTNRSGDVLTVTRGYEGTSAVNHNTAGRTYLVLLTLTKSMWDQIQTDITVAAGNVASSSQIRSGIGSPEGAQSGNTGDLYLRKDGTDNYTTAYFKVTGSGTLTGWVALWIQPNWASPGNIGITAAAKGVFTDFTVENTFLLRPDTPTYGANITIDISLGPVKIITATNGTAFQVNNPTNGNSWELLIVKIKNSSGGALGTITWDTAYKMASFTKPANGYSRTVVFYSENSGGSTWYEYWCGPEVPN